MSFLSTLADVAAIVQAAAALAGLALAATTVRVWIRQTQRHVQS